MFSADRHNFGKQVEEITRASETWFRKPRPTFWEGLFFGKDSSLVNCFNEIGANGFKPLSQYFFNLEIQNETEWLGYSKKIETADIKPTLEHFYAFGALTAYSYIFGIRDLHQHNLVMTPTHLQAVDIEVVLTKLILPSETILWPFKTVNWDFAGIGRLTNSSPQFTQKEVQSVFAGYFDLFSCAFKNKEAIEDTLKASGIKKYPSRMIMRNTSDYTKYLNGTLDLNLLESEKLQISRNDIPFYFKFIGKKDLFWLSSPEASSKEMQLGIFQDDVDRHSIDPTILLEENLSTPRKMIQGALHMMRFFSDSKDLKTFSLKNNLEISILERKLVINSKIYITK